MTGEITGTVTDGSANAISGATVAAFDADTGATEATTTSDGSGSYTVTVADGTYDVRASADGHKLAYSTGVIVSGSTETADLVAPDLTYKAAGEFTDAAGIAVFGRNNTTDGTPTGVRGEALDPKGYGLATPGDAKVEGTLATTGSHEVTVDGDRVVTYGQSGTDADGYTTGHNVVAGHPNNAVNDGALGVVVGGGGNDDGSGVHGNNVAAGNYATVSGGKGNKSTATAATTAGGRENEASARGAAVGGGGGNDATAKYATVVGGFRNEASGVRATVGGGGPINDSAFPGNVASGDRSTVPGGLGNLASGADSFAAGAYAEAADDHSFVWNDGSGANDSTGGTSDRFSSSTSDGTSGVTGMHTFHVKATGGVRIVTDGTNDEVAYIPGNSAGWSSTSTRAAKTNVDPVDPEAILEGVEEIGVSTWEYRDENGDGAGMTHVGLMAEEFHDAFDVGDGDSAINSINADGVAFAAIQGLAGRLDAKDERIEKLEAANDRRDERIGEQADRIDDLEAANETLRERLADLEARIVDDRGGGQGEVPADD